MKRHLERHDKPERSRGPDFPEQFARLARTRIAQERAVSLCRMFLIGKETGQWAECSFGHLTDAQVIELILAILEDAWPKPA